MKQMNEFMVIRQLTEDDKVISQEFYSVEDFLAQCMSDDMDVALCRQNEIIEISTTLIIKPSFDIIADVETYFMGYLQAKIDNGYEPRNPIFNFMKTII